MRKNRLSKQKRKKLIGYFVWGDSRKSFRNIYSRVVLLQFKGADITTPKGDLVLQGGTEIDERRAKIVKGNVDKIPALGY